MLLGGSGCSTLAIGIRFVFKEKLHNRAKPYPNLLGSTVPKLLKNEFVSTIFSLWDSNVAF